jgi:CubicO group peptidase (beta-lactamase class C family)
MVAPVLQACPTAGLVVGVSWHGHDRVYGFAPRVTEQAPDGRTIYEIGSLTKVFTTSLLAALVAEGRLRLDDSVRDHLAELAHFPSEITLRRLATHTSGLPRLPADWRFLLTVLRNRQNPYANYTTDELFVWLGRYTKAPSSDRRVVYSNLGVGLLGHVCAGAAGTSYEEAVALRICRPLGLVDTSVALPMDKATRLAAPHSHRGKPTSSWDLPAFAGAGALRSTADDMLRFLQANLDPERSLPALALCHGVQVAKPAMGLSPLVQRVARVIGFVRGRSARSARTARFEPGRFRVALGWMCSVDDRGLDVHWHNGGTGGYRTFAGFARRERVAVVVLVNRGAGPGDMAVDDVGFGALRLLCEAPPESVSSN